MFFLDSLHAKCHKTVDEPHKDCAQGKDRFPLSIDDAIEMLTAIQQRERRSQRRSSDRSHTSFFEAQSGGESGCGSDYESYDEVQ